MSEVNLIAVTQPKITKDGLDVGLEPSKMTPMSAEEFIAYCARVSNPSNQASMDTANKLLKYLVKNKHWSPFEMVSITMEIKTTRDIGRQILRHRSFSFQEFSQRYATVVNFSESREARLQDTKNRQNSIETNDEEIQKDWKGLQDAVKFNAESVYKWALDHGIAKEQARVVLPEGLTMSHMYMSGSLRSWITYIAMREKNGTQKEHREIALECKRLLSYEFPSVSEALSNGSGEWIV